MQKVNVRVNEHFGDQDISLSFPDMWKVEVVEMACKDTPPMSDEKIQSVLDYSIGASNIVEQAKGKKGKIVVTCDDLSRPTPAYRVFPFIVEQLHEAGISDSQIFILGSFGCHHPMNLDSFARKIGNWAVAKYDCVNHNPFNNFDNLGRTSAGTPVLVNQEFAKADLRICISGLKKHIWAGAGGGGKAVIPGVSSIDSILYNHSIIEGHRPIDRRIWWVEGNPERKDMQEYARMADLNVSVNCVYDIKRDLIGLYPGDVDDAWKKAVKDCYRAHDSKTAPKSDIVVINAYPQADQDIDWWGAQASLREGGTAVAIHYFTMGSTLLHYRSEQMGAPWKRIHSYPNRRWPVKQAENTIIFTNRPSKRQMLAYSDKLVWLTKWESVLEQLIKIHGEEASVAIYPSGKLQFDSAKNSLSI